MASSLINLPVSLPSPLRNVTYLADISGMDTNGNLTQAVVRRVPGVDPRRTEQILQEQDGVLDASVWFHEGDLAAHVTIRDDSNWNVRSLQAVCLDQLGLHQTPRTVLLISARPTTGSSLFCRAA